MLNAIEGFDQAGMLGLGKDDDQVDVIDLVLLRWFVTMRGLGLMERQMVDGAEYTWASSELAIRHIPILRITNPRVITRRLAKLERLGLLKRHYVGLGKGRGAKVYYDVTDELRNLLIRNDAKHSKVPSNDLRSTQKCLQGDTQKCAQSIKRSKELEDGGVTAAAAPSQNRKPSPLSRWAEPLREMRDAYRDRYGVGLRYSQQETARAFRELDADDQLAAAFRIYLDDIGTRGYLAEQRHPWRLFLRDLSSYAARVRNAVAYDPFAATDREYEEMMRERSS